MNIEDVQLGYRIPVLIKYPSAVQLFRFSAVTWNAHRIHYDKDYSQSEGYPDVLVQSHLHGCFLVEAALAWTGERGRLRRFRWENRHYSVPGDVLTCTGVVTRLHEGGELLDLELEEHNQDGVLCAPGWATIELKKTVLERDR